MGSHLHVKLMVAHPEEELVNNHILPHMVIHNEPCQISELLYSLNKEVYIL